MEYSLSIQRGWLAERSDFLKSGKTFSRLWQLFTWRKGGKAHCVVSYIHIFINTFNYQYLMITGGSKGGRYLDSTEIFSENIWRTVDAKLSAPKTGLRIATINKRVLAFGTEIH